MSQDQKYTSFPYIFSSRGVYARFTIDRPPGEGYYLNLSSAEEREEQSLSSRYGSLVINRDAFGIGTNNYFFASAPSTLARLVSGPSTWRYAGLANGQLWRRATDTQGIFSQIASGLSGNQFSFIVTPCFQSAQPYLFIADSNLMLKDSGSGSPVSWGISTPGQVANTLAYAPRVTQIDSFQLSTGYTTSGFTITGISTFATVNGLTGTSVLSGDHEIYTCTDQSAALAQDGSIGVDQTNSQLGLKFGTAQDTSTFNIIDFAGVYTSPASFVYKQVTGTVAANSIGSIGKTVALNLSQFNVNDLIVLVLAISAPAAVSEVRLQFDVNGSGYTSEYYYKSISPTTFQTGVSTPLAVSPQQAVTNEVSGSAGGIIDQNIIGSIPTTQPIETTDPNVSALQPRPLTTGISSWTVVYMRLGDFVTVGNAGEPGLDWAHITGWQIQFITNNVGSISVGLNGLYIQKGGGPSSYGGAGYDYRYTWFDAVTNTEGNPCGQQYFAVTQSNPGGVSLLFPLRQALNVQGQYSPNPRVTHVRIYRRGGTLPGIAGAEWLLVDQIPNVTGTGTFSYKDIFSDAQIAESTPLNLANDPPVSSTLQNPIVTTLVGGINPSPPFFPTTVNVTNGAAQFFVGQIVNIGTPANLEQVVVAVGGTGTFQACIQLFHSGGEPVQAFSIPAQPCSLAVLAYNQVWLAGDPNNPHLLYYSNPGLPENFPPQNYIPVSNPSDPIMGMVNFRGTLFVATKSTWYQIYPGSPPTAQPTGSKHGLAASYGFVQTESAIWYQSWDGIREFRGSDGAYQSALIEWLFQNQPTSPSPSPLIPLNQSLIGQVKMAYWNNRVFVVYPGQDGNNHRLIFFTTYSRWRNDDLYVNALNYESDTNTLVIARVSVPGAAQGSNYAFCQDQVGDFDDSGYSAGSLVQSPVSFNIQTPYYDQSKPDNQKQYNVFDVDANPRGQVLTLTLLFDDNNGVIAPIVLPTFTGTLRRKFQFIINSGLGQRAYRLSAQLTGSVVVAPIIYQMDMDATVLPEVVNSYDTYWLKFGTDESKLVKQGWFDYNANEPVTVQLFADGSLTPYYTFTLPINTTRTEVPTRVRFPVAKLRLFRIVATSATGSFQFWTAVQIDQKPVKVGSGYSRSELVTQ